MALQVCPHVKSSSGVSTSDHQKFEVRLAAKYLVQTIGDDLLFAVLNIDHDYAYLLLTATTTDEYAGIASFEQRLNLIDLRPREVVIEVEHGLWPLPFRWIVFDLNSQSRYTD